MTLSFSNRLIEKMKSGYVSGELNNAMAMPLIALTNAINDQSIRRSFGKRHENFLARRLHDHCSGRLARPGKSWSHHARAVFVVHANRSGAVGREYAINTIIECNQFSF
jgi:hypothetical protein